MVNVIEYDSEVTCARVVLQKRDLMVWMKQTQIIRIDEIVDLCLINEDIDVPHNAQKEIIQALNLHQEQNQVTLLKRIFDEQRRTRAMIEDMTDEMIG